MHFILKTDATYELLNLGYSLYNYITISTTYSFSRTNTLPYVIILKFKIIIVILLATNFVIARVKGRRHQMEASLHYWPLWGETTGHRWIPLTKASNVGLWCFLWCVPEQTGRNSGDAGDMRRHGTNHNVTVLTFFVSSPLPGLDL